MSGEWRVVSGEWRVVGCGAWRVGDLCVSTRSTLSTWSTLSTSSTWSTGRRPLALKDLRSFHPLGAEIDCPFGAKTVIIEAFSASGGGAGMRLSREAWASGRRKLFVVSLVAQDRSTESTELRSAQSLGASGARTSSSYANTYTYTGRRWDADLSLYYFRARYYDSETDRFLRRDADFMDGLSPYRQYFALKSLDPCGLWTVRGV